MQNRVQSLTGDVRRIVLRISLLGFLIFAAGYSFGATYYVDSVAGSDGNSGTSINAPWKSLAKVNSVVFQPGDQILLKAGSQFSGQLKPQGSGQSGSPITLDSYGTGAMPRIDGGGILPAPLWLNNVEYWHVRNIELTNTGATRQDGQYGVLVSIYNFGVAHDIELSGLYIHDVNGILTKGGIGSAGIFWRNTGPSTVSYFDGLLIANCHLVRTDREGIKGRSGFYRRDNWHPSLNVVIRGNLLEDIGGDGITPYGCDGALVEQNVICGGRMRTEEYAAGIWPWSCDNTVIQFNEVSDYQGCLDGQAFDADYNCQNTLIQYNYSHDNEGGFALLCNMASTMPTNIGNINPVIRYNISQNDGTPLQPDGERGPIFNVYGWVEGARIYNNTIYVDEKSQATQALYMVHVNGSSETVGWANDLQFANNIFMVEGEATFNMGQATQVAFDHNVYAGDFVNRPVDSYPITDDPMLMEPGSGEDGIDTLSGYCLASDSPVREAGLQIPDSGGRDIVGTLLPEVGYPSAGAFQWDTVVACYSADFSLTSPLTNGWSYLWNAPTDWVANGATGDLSSGTIGNASNYLSLVAVDGIWTPDGDTDTSHVPDRSLRLTSTGGYAGGGTQYSGNAGRYAIAAYTIPESGFYVLTNSILARPSTDQDGVELYLHINDCAPVSVGYVAPGETNCFDTSLGFLAVGDTVYVGVGPHGTSYCDQFDMDFMLIKKCVITAAGYRDDFQNGTFPTNWRYQWNAPDGWVAGGSSGDMNTGDIGQTNCYVDLLNAGSFWTADGDTDGTDQNPNRYLSLKSWGGLPGAAAGMYDNGLDRYAIAAYTVQEDGFYAVANSTLTRTSATGDPVEVLVYVNGQSPILTCMAEPTHTIRFDTALGWLKTGDVVYVAFGPDDSDGCDDLSNLDYKILYCKNAVKVAGYRDDFQNGTFPPNWRYQWNAPDGWVAGGSSGDMNTGDIGQTNCYVDLFDAGNYWTADGDTDGTDQNPNRYLSLKSWGGLPGAAAGMYGNGLDRYAIAAYTVQEDGFYAIENSTLTKSSAYGDSVEVRVSVNGQSPVLTRMADPAQTICFDTALGWLNAGDVIYTAFGPDDADGSDDFSLDYSIFCYQ